MASYENIAYGNLNATEEQILSAAKSAQLWDFISESPDGIRTRIGEYGSRLSGGQRQRVAIARALVKDADLVLLDEPTSALDSKTEGELLSAFARLLKGKASLVVTHRYSLLADVDHIVCLNDEGRIVESGTPEALLAAKGYFYQISQMQGGAVHHVDA